MKPAVDYTLYLVTDRTLMSADTVEQCVEKAILGGCTLVQLREKELPSRAFYDTAQKVREVTRHHGVPLIINDRVDIALAVEADGVHIGQDDLPAGRVRELLGPDIILGVSAGNLKEALAARDAGADYLGVGAMFSTDTKSDARLTTIGELKQIHAAVQLPIVVIGGINQNTIPLFWGLGIDGIAVVSAIVAQPDIRAAAHEVKELFLRGGLA